VKLWDLRPGDVDIREFLGRVKVVLIFGIGVIFAIIIHQIFGVIWIIPKATVVYVKSSCYT